MGCNTSTLDRLPAVALCRDRCRFLDEALRQSYALADAHAAHMHSLETLGPALHCFFAQLEDSDAVEPAASPDSDSHVLLHHSPHDTDKEKESQFLFNPTRYDYSPPPSSSAWDFFNLFEIETSSFEKYQVPYSPSGETDVKEKEDNTGEGVDGSHSHGSGTRGGGEVNEPEERGRRSHSPKAISEAMTHVQILFQRASDSGIPVLEMLDVGKLRYHQNIAVNPVSCKMMNVFTPSIKSSLLCLGPRMGLDKYKGLSNGNLCCTLKKLCMWEKKLYDEVRAEEKLRMLHENKCRLLRRMKKKGADAHKVDSVENFIGILATKMKISIQVVDKISNTICKLREEELWPQINKFIVRFHEMWKDMLECYRCQYQKIAEAKSLEASSFNRKLSNSLLEAALKLKAEMQNWYLSFSDWIYAQKSHVKALNGWLVRCLLYEPEEVPDGTYPFSPTRIGASPVFVICTKWSRAVDNLPEKDIIEAINGFILKVNELLQKHISDLQQKLTGDKELERKLKILERQEQKMHKVVQARERKMVPMAKEEADYQLRGDAVHHDELVDTINLQSGLKHIIEAIERFTATTARTYEELCKQIEQDNRVLGESNDIN